MAQSEVDVNAVRLGARSVVWPDSPASS